MQTISQFNYNNYPARQYAAGGIAPVVRFVGIHNKPRMKPLDSKTMSGKMIDAIIKELPFACSKTNLCEVEYVPANILEINEAGILWLEKYEPKEYDVIVLLGSWVHENFCPDGFSIIKLSHPASIFGNVNKVKYMHHAVTQIMKAVEQNLYRHRMMI